MNRRAFLLSATAIPVVGIPPPADTLSFRVAATRPDRVIIDDPTLKAGDEVEVSYSFGPGTLYANGREVGRVTDFQVTRPRK